jgi:hypothetical protein
MQRFVVVFLLLLNCASIASTELDDADEFDDDFGVIVIEEDAPQDTKEQNTSVYGSVVFETHYNYQKSNKTKNLSSAKILLDIIGEHRMQNGSKINANIKGYHDFVYSTNLGNYVNTPEGYENETNLNELYIQGSISSDLDFSIGKQVVVWGKADTVRVTDILNPLDLRIPGMVDIRNLRLGRVMSKLDYYIDNLNLSLIGIHENRFSIMSKQYSDFRPNLANSPTNKPKNNLSNTGLALSVSGAFEGYDAALYFADIYVDKPYLSGGVLHYDNKSKMYGIAFSSTVDNILVKAESAYFDSIKYTGISELKSRHDTMLGIDYNGITDGSLGYEIAYRTINDYDSAIYTATNAFKRRNEIQHSLRINKSYQNQTVDLNGQISMFGKSGRDGGSFRASIDYSVNDDVSLSGGVLNFIGGDSPILESIKDNDRLFLKATYIF